MEVRSDRPTVAGGIHCQDCSPRVLLPSWTLGCPSRPMPEEDLARQDRVVIHHDRLLANFANCAPLRACRRLALIY